MTSVVYLEAVDFFRSFVKVIKKKIKTRKYAQMTRDFYMGILNRCRWFGTELSFVGFYKVHFFKVSNKTTRIETHK